MLLEVNNLKTYFYADNRISKAVDGVSFTLQQGKTLGIAGESGCGKSLTALSILRLVPAPGKITGGSIVYNGENITNKPEKDMRHIRGKEISIIFQDPQTSLNPVFTIGNQITEAIELHTPEFKNNSKIIAVDMLSKVGIPNPEMRFGQYPHELSGGQQQRAMIAMALACKPKLLIADEPTTALDVTVQAQILDLLEKIQKEMGLSIIFISHDLSVLKDITDTMAIMYAGRIVEDGLSSLLYANPLHPYTKGLFETLPSLRGKGTRLATIPGRVPDVWDLPNGCKFHPRCAHKMAICEKEEPELKEIEKEHKTACWLYNKR
ncbi:MAG: peptide ABC transporter ATP-binding protein [Elusimicrobia bacterium RIFOXYA2_FULL_39_19]|nr:MAG: peptide ABC transporter ATP-binding protein [Elusimicrobia bacterium RIFOXYA2_FULL_39_19]